MTGNPLTEKLHDQHFTLIPFTAGPASLSITGTVAISGASAGISPNRTVQVWFQLQGNLDKLKIAPDANPAERRDLLWQTTCLEIFLGRQGANDYWEFNLSPAGHWNVYHLDDYRQGLKPEPAYRELPFQLTRSQQELSLTLHCPLPPGLLQQDPAAGVDVGITAVVEQEDGSIGYWALHHPAAEADFHHRGGFCINLR